jgi:hypothetical protein
VSCSDDGKRVYVTNSLYGSWDLIFYPDGVGAWAAKLDADLDSGGLVVDAQFFANGNDFHGLRVHPRVARWQDRLTLLQRRLAGGCHLNRPIIRLVADSGLRLTRMENYYAKGPKPFGYMFEGTAIKA